MKPYSTVILSLSAFILSLNAQLAVQNKADFILELNKQKVSLKNQFCTLSDLLQPFVLESVIVKEFTNNGSIIIMLDTCISHECAKYLGLFVHWLELLKYKKQMSLTPKNHHYSKLWNVESIMPLLWLSDYFMVADLRKKFIRKCAYYLHSGDVKFEEIPQNFKSEIATAYFLIFHKTYPATQDYIRTTLSQLAEFNHISKKSRETTKFTNLFLRHIFHISDYVNPETITHLNLSHNYLRALPVELQKLQKLKQLDVSFNMLTEFPEHVPVTIEKLNLYHNNIETLDNYQLLKFKKLKEISLAYNKIRSICILAPQSLKTICSQGNPLSFLPIVMYPKNTQDSSHHEPV